MDKKEYYHRLEIAIEYIEKNLQCAISLSDISKVAFSSLSHFHRIFYFMTGRTLKEYIRQRRLSIAAIQLISTDKSVLDISLEAQFESPESFNKSFRKLFNISPREFRQQKPEFSIIRKMEVHPNEQQCPPNISLNFIYLQAQIISGVKTRTTLDNNQQTIDIPQHFEKVMKNHFLENLTHTIDKQIFYGIYSDMSDEEEFDYTLGFKVAGPSSDPLFSNHLLPEGEYAHFTVQGDPSVLKDAWHYIYGSWMPNSGRTRRKGLDFEIYYKDKTEIYIPMHPQTLK